MAGAKQREVHLPDKHFVHALGSERGLHETGDRARSHNINLKSAENQIEAGCF